MNEQHDPQALISLGLSFWSAKTLLSAVELGVFTELAGAPLAGDVLARRLGLHPRGARDFFDALIALKMLECSDGLYANTPLTDSYLDRAKPTYIGGILELANARLYPVWGALTEALRSGQPQNEAKEEEKGYYDNLCRDPVRLRNFLQGMTGLSMEASKGIAEKFPWPGYSTFVDLGGAQGVLSIQLATAHDHLMGGSFDLSPIGPFFDEYVASFGLERRLRFYPGDFFKDPLPAADVFIMGHVLHNWALEEKRLLIRKAYEALRPAGVLLVYEALIDDARSQNVFGLLMSLNMLLVTSGGFVFTGPECETWMREAGFSQTRVEHLVGPDSMVIGIK